uniref:Putative ovule protein n=1 Tax=Solanum chacoense TaxID=4108 RepID=A0A0V0HDI0_SOLCH
MFPNCPPAASSEESLIWQFFSNPSSNFVIFNVRLAAEEMLNIIHFFLLKKIFFFINIPFYQISFDNLVR